MMYAANISPTLFFIRNEIHVCYGINMFNILMISSLWNNINSNSMY